MAVRDARRLIAGLVPRAFGPMTDEMAEALAELEVLVEQRAGALTTAAISDNEAWIKRCGRRPHESAAEQAWSIAVRVIAAYRDLHGVTGDHPLGPPPSSDRERLDHYRANAALREARALSVSRGARRPEQSRRQAQLLDHV